MEDSSSTADETFKARVISDFETGAEPDVMFYFNGNDSNPFVEAGKVVPISEIREEYPEYADNMKDDMIPASPVDGVQYAVPFYGHWEGLASLHILLTPSTPSPLISQGKGACFITISPLTASGFL